MMNGFMPPAGSSSSLKSGTSGPLQVVPFQLTSLRVGSNGLPLVSAEARLYSTRRLAGQAQAQFSVLPMPVGSLLSRRPIWLPAWVQEPAKIQQPEVVVPSSRSMAKLGNCSPFLTSTLVGSFGSVTSANALPLNSIASSSGVGLNGLAYGQVRFTIGSGNLPPSFWYICFMRRNRPDMISRSERAWPGG